MAKTVDPKTRDFEVGQRLEHEAKLFAQRLDSQLKGLDPDAKHPYKFVHYPKQNTGERWETVLDSPNVKAGLYAIAKPNVLSDEHSTPFVPIKKTDDGGEICIAMKKRTGVDEILGDLRVALVKKTGEGEVFELEPEKSGVTPLEAREGLVNYLGRVNQSPQPFARVLHEKGPEHAEVMKDIIKRSQEAALTAFEKALKQK